jgi:hypothetical protein
VPGVAYISAFRLAMERGRIRALLAPAIAAVEASRERGS